MSKKTWIALGALIVVLAIMVGVFVRNNPQAQKGNKAITITVVHGNGTENVFTCRTDAEYLDEVLLAVMQEKDQLSSGMRRNMTLLARASWLYRLLVKARNVCNAEND